MYEFFSLQSEDSVKNVSIFSKKKKKGKRITFIIFNKFYIYLDHAAILIKFFYVEIRI